MAFGISTAFIAAGTSFRPLPVMRATTTSSGFIVPCPFSFFTPAMDAAAAVGAGEVRVAQGTYTPTNDTNRTISIELRSRVAVYGGYAGLGEPDPDLRDWQQHSTILGCSR